jgi:hypothetical protein
MIVADLSCTGAFLTPGVALQAGSNYPVAMRYESGVRHYYVVDGLTQLQSFPEPSLSSCSTALASLNRASLDSYSSSWGAITVHSSNPDADPFGASGGIINGATFDVSNRLIVSWSGTYSNLGSYNGFAAVTLDSVGHTQSTSGCWGVSGAKQVQIGSGIVTIPSAFVASYLPAGASWGIGMGFPYATVGSGISEGPTMYAVVPPSNNACAANTDTFVSGTKLWGYDANSVGPNCDSTGGIQIGCTPSQTPTTPYPAQVADTRYSLSVYATDWEAYAGHGWMHFLTHGAYAWYDDGVKHAIVVPFTTSEGWIGTTVASSTSSTDFVASSISTHDSLNLNPGDVIWVQTCDPNNDAGCAGGNGRELTIAQINTINTSTKAINYTIINGDFGSGNHFPIAGKPLYAGCIYAHGSPSCSRWIMRMQMYDPAALAAVAQGAQPYNVTAVDDQEIDQTLITSYGSPTAGSGIPQTTLGSTYAPYSVIPDTTTHDIIVVIPNSANPPFLVSDAVFILHVNEPIPRPVVSPRKEPR